MPQSWWELITGRTNTDMELKLQTDNQNPSSRQLDQPGYSILH